ncbi:Mannose glucose-specific lectin [Musa troglodytarum]|uniref:Mannose glucose-specific lectin n=1 Tax=Musa troglodytarum TaxID=320322 RepID=A0A9E7HQJ2_9LILI|nr:Mannose glucose-specific lectin [Musa troglodytarum]
MHACVQAGAVIKVGKWGADGGSHWDTGPADHIKGIKINAAGVVDSITFMYVIGETADETPRYGGPGGKHNQACLLFHLTCYRFPSIRHQRNIKHKQY